MNSKAVLMRILVLLGIVSPLFLAGCGGSTASTVNNQPPPPAPPAGVSFSLNPTSLAFGSQTINATSAPMTVTLTNTGSAAAPIEVVAINGFEFKDFAQTNNCPSVIAPGASCTISVTFTPTTTGDRMALLVINDESHLVNLTGTGTAATTNPVPTINALSPTGAPVGGLAFTLTVFGSNFVATSVARWNGSDRPTAFVNSSQVAAQIPAGDIAATGTAAITVFNPPPGGGTSNSLNFSMVTGLGPVSVAVAPDPSGKFGKFAYVANRDSNNISMYTVNATTGTLTSIGTIDAGLGPSSVTVYPSGRFAYVINHNLGISDYISMFTIDATTGALTSTGTVAAPYAMSMAVDPSGKLAYVAFCNGVYTYSINGATGTLTSIGRVDAPFSTCSLSPQSLAVHPSGKFVYLASADEERLGRPEGVTMYTINASTGELTSIGVVQTGLAPWSVAIDPSGKFAYVANLYSGNISIFNVNATTGTLTSVGTIDAGGSPSSVAVDPSGRFAYITNGNVSMYTVNATTGALTSIGTIAAGLAPNSIAIDPSGKFAYVANAGSNNVSIYSIDAATGVLTFIGTIGT